MLAPSDNTTMYLYGNKKMGIRVGQISLKGSHMALIFEQDNLWKSKSLVYYMTGDHGEVKQQDSSIHIMGRKDDIIGIGGKNYSLSLLEQKIADILRIKKTDIAISFKKDKNPYGYVLKIFVSSHCDAKTISEFEYLKIIRMKLEIPKSIYTLSIMKDYKLSIQD